MSNGKSQNPERTLSNDSKDRERIVGDEECIALCIDKERNFLHY